MILPYEGKTAAALTGGGDTTALNESIASIVEAGSNVGFRRILGIVDGFKGISEYPDSAVRDLRSDIIPHWEGGSILGSIRTPKNGDSSFYRTIAENLRRYGIDVLIVIGGDGSSAVAQRLYDQEGFPVLVVPKTVDNNLRMLTSHEHGGVHVESAVCPGYVTGARYVSNEFYRLQTTASTHRQIMVVETMGDRTGWVAAAAYHGGGDIIFCPELPIKEERDLVYLVRSAFESRKGKLHLMISVAEGFRPNGYDASQHGRIGDYVELLIRKNLREADVKSERIGRQIRAGEPEMYDHELARLMGSKLTQLFLHGIEDGRIVLQNFGRIVTLKKLVPYEGLDISQIGDMPINEVIRQPSGLPAEYIDPKTGRGTEMLKAFLETLLGKMHPQKTIPRFRVVHLPAEPKTF